MYVPEFEVDEEMLALVSEIETLIDRIPDNEFSEDFRLRRANRIRSIQSSVAIEGNTLSVKKVSDIVDGKPVIGSAREVQEVKGAIDAYNLINVLDPHSTDDLLRAHKAMTAGLVDDPGRFRRCNVGVYKGNVPIHIAPEYEDVPHLMNDLMTWTKGSDLHPLIKSCIFHCRFEYIHPFVDGNGRMGRLWHGLILSKWKELFAFLPTESWIKLNQNEYYDVLMEADNGSVGIFVKFMLGIILEALDELADGVTYS